MAVPYTTATPVDFRHTIAPEVVEIRELTTPFELVREINPEEISIDPFAPWGYENGLDEEERFTVAAPFSINDGN